MGKSRRENKEQVIDHLSSAELPQRNAANARERLRMRVLSKAFVKLKTTLPWVPADTKLSKLDTLRLATTYIAHLRQILQSDNVINSHVPRSEMSVPTMTYQNRQKPKQRSMHPVALTWPFAANGTGNMSSQQIVPEYKEVESNFTIMSHEHCFKIKKDAEQQ